MPLINWNEGISCPGLGLSVGAPADGGTCLARTPWCRHCYATHGNYRYPSTVENLRRRTERLLGLLSTEDTQGIAEWGMSDLRQLHYVEGRDVRCLRLSTSGDLLNTAHLDAYVQLSRMARKEFKTRTFIFTRIWSLGEEMRAHLASAEAEGVTVWYSVDPTSTDEHGELVIERVLRDRALFDHHRVAIVGLPTERLAFNCRKQTENLPGKCRACGFCWGSKAEGLLAFKRH